MAMLWRWNGLQVRREIGRGVRGRLKKAAAHLRRKVVKNISIPVVVTGSHIIRSKPFEFPRTETARLRKDIFWEMIGEHEAAVGTTIDYGAELEFRMSRSFLRRSLREEARAIRHILLVTVATSETETAMMVEPRGTHLVDCGIVERWELVNLDAVFKSYWPDDDKKDRYEPFNFIEARPDSPHPYCVYERQPPIEKGHSVGRDFYEEFQYEDVLIQFRVHAKAAGDTDAKTVCETLAMLIKRAFDPGTPLLDMSPDRHSATISEGDWVVREGDQEYFYVIQYLLRIENTYGRAETNELPTYDDSTIASLTGEL